MTKFKLSLLLLGNLVLAAAIGLVGWPSIIAVAHQMPIDGALTAARAGQLPGRPETQMLLDDLAAAELTSPAAGEDRAYILLRDASRADGDPAKRAVELAQAVKEFRRYLSNVPGDSFGWAGLVDALLGQQRQLDASRALKMSMVTSPRSPSLLLWRCGVGLELFYVLDAEGRDLLEQQFRLATEWAPGAVANLAIERTAVPIVRALLENSPEARAKFDQRLALLRP